MQVGMVWCFLGPTNAWGPGAFTYAPYLNPTFFKLTCTCGLHKPGKCTQLLSY